KQVNESARILTEAEELSRGSREKRTSLFEVMQEATQRVFNLRSQKENAANQAEMARLRIEDHEQRIEQMKKDVASLGSEREELEQRLSGNLQDRQMALDMFGNSDQQFQNQNQEFNQLQKNVHELEQLFSRARQQLLIREGG